MYRQYVLESGLRRTHGWLDTPRPLKYGQRLTTKEHGPAIVWTIVAVGHIELHDPPDRRWRVGGIEHPLT